MHSIALLTVLTVGTLLVCFAGPAVAIFLLLRRRRFARNRKRSPLTSELLRGPGHSLREELIEAQDDLILELTFLIVLPAVVLALVLGQKLFASELGSQPPIWLYVLALVTLEAYLIRRLLLAATRIDQLRLGYDGELAVGQELDQLMRQGAHVFHDVPGEKFNIDHVVVSPAGIFAVETKGYSKPNEPGSEAATVTYDGECLRFPTWTSAKPIAQAERQAAWLSKWITSALATPLAATPVLALPGWFVKRDGRGSVHVLNGKQLAGLLRTRGTQPLTSQDVERAAHQLMQRCRTVPSQYTGSDQR